MIARTALGLLAALFLSSAAHAQIFRAYLALNGSDANPCTLPQPCRLLPAALSAVASGGEIWLLDSANYNTATVNITKSVTILGVPGVVGSVVATGGPAISIATAGVKVALRNLVLVPLPGGGGTTGVAMTAGQSLTVDDSLIAGMPNYGIFVSGASTVSISGSTIRDSGEAGLLLQDGPRATVVRSNFGGNAAFGIRVNASTAGALSTADVSETTLEDSLYGVLAYTSDPGAEAGMNLRNSRVLRTTYGVSVATGDIGLAWLTATGNVVSGNQFGVSVGGAAARAVVAGNVVSDNVVGLSRSSGILQSVGNNVMLSNTQDSSGAITPATTL